MSGKNLYPPLMQTSNIFSPPEIEKILDTTLTKDNERYYKVKWVKVTWESESDLAFFGNIINQFWTQYTQESLLLDGTESSQQDLQCDDNLDQDDDITPHLDHPDGITTHLDHPDAHTPHKDIVEKRQNPFTTDIHSNNSNNKEILQTEFSETASSVDLVQHMEKSLAYTSNEQNYIDPKFNKSINIPDGFAHLPVPNIDLTELCDTAATVTNSFMCNQCNKAFLTMTRLVTHQRTDCIPVVFQCSICNGEFKRKESLDKHILGHSSKKCQLCGKEFTRIAYLKTHILTHANIRPWSCSECEKSFTDKSSLSKHQLVHTGLRNFPCDICGKSFQRAQHLRRHKETHDNIKNFECKECGKKFNQKHTLKVHLNRHSGQKPHKCNTCGRPFTDRSALQKHMFIHTGEKPHKCNICNKAFSRVSSYNGHMLRKHKKIVEKRQIVRKDVGGGTKNKANDKLHDVSEKSISVERNLPTDHIYTKLSHVGSLERCLTEALRSSSLYEKN